MRTADTPATRATRDRILDGAQAVLTRQGLRNSTVQHVLEEAGVSRRTFYQYFPSLEGVSLALYEQFTDAMARDMAARMDATSDPIERVKAAIGAYLDLQQSHGDLIVAFQAEAIGRDSPLAARREQTIDKMVTLVDRGIQESLGVKLDLLLIRSLLMAVEAAVIATQSTGTFTDADRRRVERVARAIFLHTLAGWEHLPRREG